MARFIVTTLQALPFILGLSAAHAQAPAASSTAPPAMEADPIAAEIDKKPAHVGERVFSPSAISTLLQQTNPSPASLQPPHDAASTANAKGKLTPGGHARAFVSRRPAAMPRPSIPWC